MERSAPGAENGPGALNGVVSMEMGRIWCGARNGLISGTAAEGDVDEEASETCSKSCCFHLVMDEWLSGVVRREQQESTIE